MNALTSLRFKSTVYPWGMEQLVHGLRGNCLFLWPAAKGEEVNGKRYERVCPPRWWIRCKLGEGAFQSPALWLFPILTALNCFLSSCSTAHSCLPHIFLNLSFLSFPPFLYLLHPLLAAGFWGCAGWQVELWEVERARAAFADCGTESWGSTAFSENAACSRNREATRSHGEVWPWAASRGKKKKKSTQIHRARTLGSQASVPRVCVHSLAYGVLLRMD